MNLLEKSVSYSTTNSYDTLNTLSKTTKNIWIVLHGIGYLSRYFLRHFEELPSHENYIIAPQAPSKYYLNTSYTRVGASWLTKEDTAREVENDLAYLEAVVQKENILDGGVLPGDYKLIVLGFSQGVSIATRWVSKHQIPCSHLVLYAGGIPNELKPSDFEFLMRNQCQVKILVGDKDEYLTAERRKRESAKIQRLFGGRAEEIVFEGGHEMKPELINALIL